MIFKKKILRLKILVILPFICNFALKIVEKSINMLLKIHKGSFIVIIRIMLSNLANKLPLSLALSQNFQVVLLKKWKLVVSLLLELLFLISNSMEMLITMINGSKIDKISL